jgi:uncharacterized membrane protein YeiH
VDALASGSVTLLEVLAVFVAAVSGGLAAVRKRFDVFGVLVLAWITGLGGGILRDVLIGDVPPVGISSWRLVATALAAGVVIFVLHPGVERMRRSIVVLVFGVRLLSLAPGTTQPSAAAGWTGRWGRGSGKM